MNEPGTKKNVYETMTIKSPSENIKYPLEIYIMKVMEKVPNKGKKSKRNGITSTVESRGNVKTLSVNWIFLVDVVGIVIPFFFKVVIRGGTLFFPKNGPLFREVAKAFGAAALTSMKSIADSTTLIIIK